MRSIRSTLTCSCRDRPEVVALASALCGLALLVAGCGGGNVITPTTPPSGPVTAASTTVVIQLSSTANDEFTAFNMTINSISLTNKAGVTTTIFNTPTDVGFIPANGNAAPFATVSVPQDVYTSAAVSVSDVSFSNVSMDSQGEIDFNTDAYGYTPTPPVVNLATPIAIEGSTMGLTLDLQAAQSGSYTGLGTSQTGYKINPTFDLTSFPVTAEATTPQTGKCLSIAAQVTAIDSAGKTMTVTIAGSPRTIGQSLTIGLNSATVFQGVASASSLQAGTLINMDIALEPDASYTATRIEVQDATTTNVATGQLIQVDPSFSYISSSAIEQQGSVLSVQPVGSGDPYVYSGSTKFQTSALFPDLSALPFNALFNSSTLAAGQMVSVGSLSISLTGGSYTLPTSITLVPQTIDAVVNRISTSGSYTVYAAQLAPYDLIVQMNSPASHAVDTIVPNANTVYVYIEPSPTLFTSTPLGIGDTFRFHGLLFNDGGVLRMICDQVNDGVAQ